MALTGIIGLIIFTYLRPHEFVPALAEINFLYIFLAVSLAGIAYEVSQRKLVLLSTPHLRYAVMFWFWCLLTLALRKPGELGVKAVGITVSLILYIVISSGIQRIQAFYKVVMVVFASGLFVAYVGADQGLQPFQCIIVNPSERNGGGIPDGRECKMVDDEGMPHEGIIDCIAGGKPGIPYQCERAGMFGTTSIGGGRVRYLGVLLDPNELSLATALAVPFAFAFLEMRATFFRLLLLIATLLVVALEIVFTQSRGGQMTFGAVLGAYFIKKYGWKRGILVGAVMVVPMLLLGGRHDESAEESTLERLGCAAAGIKMVMAYPFTGVGYTQYTEHHPLTAHNAYVLAAGELGGPGMWLFGILIYLAIKVPITVIRFEMPESRETVQIKALAMAMLAAIIGGALGIYFLSWCYHFVLWIHFGMIGALYNCVKRQYPGYACRLTWKEARTILVGYIVYLFVWSGYIKWKGAWDH